MKNMRLLQRTALPQLLETRSPLLRQSLRQLQQTSQQPFRTRPPLQNVPPIRSLHTQRPPKNILSQVFRSSRGRGRRYNSSSSSTTSASGASEEPSLSFSQRMKKLSREYGWAALGVYLALTALDLPFCFLAVRMLGTDRIGHWEHVVIETFKGLVKWPLSTAAQEKIDAAGDLVNEKVSDAVAVVGEGGGDGEGEGRRVLEESSSQYRADEIEDHGYKEADKANRGADASMLCHSSHLVPCLCLSGYLASFLTTDHTLPHLGIWTQLGLAYVIHKSFIFVRVPLAAAITPKVVKTLRSWGWNIGKMPSRKGVISASGSKSSATTAGVNTKGSKVRPDD